ncbi:hypothetical protein [Roseomonas chloroacetimidivorans]|uniref:hypothetical protein n=1 Tax=Roseomonas chloroacetimidivorans TaxID=1766656 RepID=UPI003C749E72
MSGELTPTSVAADDLRAAAEDMEQAAWRMGLAPHEPLGIWVASMRRTVTGLADLTERQAEAVAATVEGTRKVLDAEVAQLRAASEAAAHQMHEAKAVLTRAQVEAEKLTLKTLQDLTPKILEEIRDAVVIREKRYNKSMEWRRYGLVGLTAVCLLLGGYAGRAWQDWSATTALAHCVENPLAAAGSVSVRARAAVTRRLPPSFILP